MGDIWVVRHGQTEWSQTGQHTGRTDVPLTSAGEVQARSLASRLDHPFSRVLTSPLARARRTAELAGLDPADEPLLLEWDYGPAEGRTTREMADAAPDGRWSVWESPPLGETVEQVGARVSVLLERLQPDLALGDVCLVAHGHVLRILTATYLRLSPRGGRLFVLPPGGVGVLGHEHATPALLSWG